jgi:putative YhdH/YhfP family quinone oxidoreductase
MFNAIYLSRDSDQFRADLRALDDAALEANTAGADVTVDIDYSTINYKDGLALTNKSPVVRKWPMVPGIDCAGTVAASASPALSAGDKVVLNGWGIGETAWGGLAQRGRYRGDWLVRVPAPLSTRDTMAIGTAGYTAMLACMAIQDAGVREGDVLVTGASGGVGSFAVAILARRGYRVFASTGKMNEEAYLRQLGASEVLDRAELSAAGLRIVSGGTDNHLFLLDLIGRSYTGKDADAALGRAHITVNKNTVPNDPRSPFVTSGLRIGTPAVTTRGMREPEMERIGEFIARVLASPDDEAVLAMVKTEVEALCREFPLYPDPLS